MYPREKGLPRMKKEQGVYRSKTESVCKSCRAARETAKSRSRAAGIWKGVYLKTVSDLSQGHSRFPPSLHDELGWPSQGNSAAKGGPGGQETRRKAAPRSHLCLFFNCCRKGGQRWEKIWEAPGKLGHSREALFCRLWGYIMLEMQAAAPISCTRNPYLQAGTFWVSFALLEELKVAWPLFC